MELKEKSNTQSEDEDDLEQLRLAALQSLRKPAVPNNPNSTIHLKKSNNIGKRGRGFQGRNSRNGQFNIRARNTNLISIPTTQGECSNLDKTSPKKSKFNDSSGISKLVLPQDRYCNTSINKEKPLEPVSKFDRYDNSDNSESDSEYESESGSESESPRKLVRTSSLEALIMELENQIHGEQEPTNEKPKIKNKVKRRKRKAVDSTNAVKDTNSEVKTETADIDNKVEVKESVPNKECETELKKETKPESPKTKPIDRRILPPHRTVFKKYHQVNSPYIPQNVAYAQPPLVIFPQNQFNNQNLPYGVTLPFSSLPPVGPPVEVRNYPPNFERALSPLTLNTDDALTIARAPLSPRSAAFVLQNREIVERRKKSPRRSYSRSPSPRYRRSKSPRPYRSLSRSPERFLPANIDKKDLTELQLSNKDRMSPLRDRKISPGRKVSPGRKDSPNRKISSRRNSPTRPTSRKTSPMRRISPNRKLSPCRRSSPTRDKRSPTREKRSPMRERSPHRKRLSPIDKSPKCNYRTPPKAPVRDRLGNKTVNLNAKVESTLQTKTNKQSLSPSPERVNEQFETKGEEPFDPVLEARKRKFESNEIKTKEGIIRLKPKLDNTKHEIPQLELTKEDISKQDRSKQDQDLQDSELNIDVTTRNEVLEMEDDYLDTNVEDLFSDEETDEENEGRFKSNLHSKRSVSVVPFAQLLRDPTRNVKSDSLMKCRHRQSKTPRDKYTDRDRKRHRSRSPLKTRDERNYSRSKNDVKSVADKKAKDGRDKLFLKNRILFRNEQRRDRDKIPVTAPIESKKIEIKIRNPAKYETTSKYDVANEHEILQIDKSVRNVEVAKKEESDLDDDTEVITDKEDIEDATQKSEGDLRAQLSRKRAERQNKLPVPEDVQSRLLQNALQGAVFKKPKKSKKEKESAPKDGKLPIHLRLGFASSIDVFKETKSHKKRKKSKSRGGIEQV